MARFSLFDPEEELKLKRETPAFLFGGIPNSTQDIPQPMQSPPSRPSMPSLFESMANKTITPTLPGEGGPASNSNVDEYGIAKPESQKQGILAKILKVAQIALPAIYGMTKGMGPLPGLMAGFAGAGKAQNTSQKQAQETYEKERTLKSGELTGLAKLQREQGRDADVQKYRQAQIENMLTSQKDLSEYRKGLLNIGQQNANKEPKLTELDQYINLKKIADKIKNKMPVTDAEVDEYEAGAEKLKVLERRYGF